MAYCWAKLVKLNLNCENIVKIDTLVTSQWWTLLHKFILIYADLLGEDNEINVKSNPGRLKKLQHLD